MKQMFDHPEGTWTAPDVTVDDLRTYANTGHRLGFTWWQRALMRAAAHILHRYDRRASR